MTDENALFNKSDSKKEIPRSLKKLTHILSIIPIAISFTIVSALAADGTVRNLASGFGAFFVLMIAGYFVILYAINGGFDWKPEKVPTGRRFLFLILSGFVFGGLLLIYWMGVRWILSKVYGIPYSNVKGKMFARE